VGTTIEAGMLVPIQHVAIGTPAAIFDPGQTEAMTSALRRQRFMARVFGVETEGRSRRDIVTEAHGRYAGALGAHLQDVVLQPG
jgi:hypothetical protein